MYVIILNIQEKKLLLLPAQVRAEAELLFWPLQSESTKGIVTDCRKLEEADVLHSTFVIGCCLSRPSYLLPHSILICSQTLLLAF